MQMASDDSIYGSLSPLNSVGYDDFSKESEPQERKQRKRRRTKKGRSQGEQSEAESKRKEESVRVLITVKKKSVRKVLKNLSDRADRRIKIDEMADMLSCIFILRFVMEHKVSWLFSVVQSLNQIVSQWPARSDPYNIKKNIKDMKDKERNKAKRPRHGDGDDDGDEKMEEVILELEKIENDIKNSDDNRLQDSEKVNKLAEIFITEGDTVETLKEKLSTDFPWLFGEAIASNKLPNAKGKGKGKEVPVKELIKKNSVANSLKNLTDRVNRRIKIGQRADMESCIRLICFVIEHRVDNLFSSLVQSLYKIKSQWPTRSHLDGIKEDIKKMEDEVRDKGELHKPDDMIQRLEEIEHKIKSSDEEFRKDSTNVINLGKLFTDEVVSNETLREELTTAFPWLFLDEIATNGLPSAINLDGNIFTTEDSTNVINLGKLFTDEGVSNETLREEFTTAFPRLFLNEIATNGLPSAINLDGNIFTTEDTASNGSYDIPQAIKVLDSLSEVPKATDLYFFSLKLLTNTEKRLVFSTISHELRAWWLREEMKDSSKLSNGT